MRATAISLQTLFETASPREELFILSKIPTTRTLLIAYLIQINVQQMEERFLWRHSVLISNLLTVSLRIIVPTQGVQWIYLNTVFILARLILFFKVIERNLVVVVFIWTVIVSILTPATHLLLATQQGETAARSLSISTLFTPIASTQNFIRIGPTEGVLSAYLATPFIKIQITESFLTIRRPWLEEQYI